MELTNVYQGTQRIKDSCFRATAVFYTFYYNEGFLQSKQNT